LTWQGNRASEFGRTQTWGDADKMRKEATEAGFSMVTIDDLTQWERAKSTR
jgi:hypothetical protein